MSEREKGQKGISEWVKKEEEEEESDEEKLIISKYNPKVSFNFLCRCAAM